MNLRAEGRWWHRVLRVLEGSVLVTYDVAPPRGPRPRRLLLIRPAWSVSPVLLVLAAAGAAFATGVALAVSPLHGAALLGGLLFVVLALRDLQLALALWIGLLLFDGNPAANLAGKGAGLALLLVWLLRRGRQCRTGPDGGDQMPTAVLLASAAVVWFTVSAVSAADTARAASALWRWVAVVVVLLVVTRVLADRRGLLCAVTGLAVAGVVSVLLSAAGASASSTSKASVLSTSRAEGAAGDPNLLAMWLLAATFLTLGLLGYARRGRVRALVCCTAGVLAAGVALTVSRGALLSAVMTLLVALVVLRGRRRQVLRLVGLLVLAGAVWLAASPAAADKLTAPDRGNGRTDLWTVALQVGRAEPLTGVGLANFTVVAPEYMREVRPLPAAYLVAGHAHEAHNTYLQLFAEAGVPGLLLFLGFATSCLSAARRAARRSWAQGRAADAQLAEAVLLAGVSMLGCLFFLSSALDRVLWIVLALGPAALLMTRKAPGRPA